MVHIMLPFLILPLYANMRTIDPDYLKAASSMGANQLRAFWTIFFPLSVPGLLAGVADRICNLPWFLCHSRRFWVVGKVIMVSMKIQSNIELFFSWGAASALGVVLLVLTIAILYVASKFCFLGSNEFAGIGDGILQSYRVGNPDFASGRGCGCTVVAILILIFLVAPSFIVVPMSFSGRSIP